MHDRSSLGRARTALAAAAISALISAGIAAPTLGASVARAATAGIAAAVPLPTVDGPIPVDGSSYPFDAASRQLRPVNLGAFGYVEAEYFLNGKANVYEWADPFDTAQVQTADALYTNRILVRRPADPQKFSGTVIVEPFNPSGGGLGYEVPYIWGDSWQYMLDRGDVWVGVTAAPSALASLKMFDPVRYAPLSWNNPLGPGQPCSSAASTESGLVWDILSQTAALLKSDEPSSPLHGLNVQSLYATSQIGGGVLPLYMNVFGPTAKTADGKPVYDGYVIESSGTPGRINQCTAAPLPTDPSAHSRSPQPVIRVFGQSDVLRGSPNHPGSTCDYRQEDSDVDTPFRAFEVPGLQIDAHYKLGAIPVAEDATRAGGIAVTPELIAVPPNEFPGRYILDGAFDNMDRWVKQGVPPPHATFIEVANDDCSELALDDFGNPLGGVRTPYVDVPTNTYPTEQTPVPFDAERLAELYKSHGDYVRKVQAKTNDLVRDHWITKEDGQAIRIEAAQSDVLKGS